MAEYNADTDAVTTGVKTVGINSDRPPVDLEMIAGKAQVYVDGPSAIYDATLIQTNLENNNYKYYVIQLLEETSRKWYHVWCRWGRVGYKGQNTLVNCGTDLEKAKSTFKKRFQEKTKNKWMNRDSFQKEADQYDLLKLDYDNKDTVASKLDPKVQELMGLIFNVKVMDMVIEMKYHIQKAPLGILTADQIEAGKLALKEIENFIENDLIDDDGFIPACDDFYTRIPHVFDMRQKPPVIETEEEYEAKYTLLEELSNIQVAFHRHPIDRKYHALKCQIKPIDKTSETFEVIQSYVLNTHGETHNHYTMTVEEVFDLDKEGEKLRFNDVGKKMLLWHGAPMTNWAGILGQGLRIAPPEAPVTGYMFGNGVYFSDMSSKSAHYCRATTTNPTGLLALCEVALGNENQLLAAKYNADALPDDKNSVKGLGRIAPNPEKNCTIDDTIVPLGEGMNTNVVNSSFKYNKYVVYSTNQIRMRYLVKVKFNFK